MRIERDFVNGKGERFRAVLEIDNVGPAIERAMRRLANKAREKKSQRASALDGAVRVTVHPIPEGG